MNGYCRIKFFIFSFFFPLKVSSDGNLPQPVASAPSRVAAVGPYIQSSTMPRIASRPELLVKPAFSEGTQALQVPDGPLKTQTLPNMRAGNSSQAKAPAGNSLQLIFFLCRHVLFPYLTVLFWCFVFLKAKCYLRCQYCYLPFFLHQWIYFRSTEVLWFNIKNEVNLSVSTLSCYRAWTRGGLFYNFYYFL